MSSHPSALKSLLQLKCPNCRKGNMFNQASIFPMNKMLDMPERCTECNLKFELETGFWFGTGYISYAISVALLIMMAVIFSLTYGFDFDDNSIFIFLGIAISCMILLQPILMRLSRALYLRIFVKFGQGQPSK
jgi:uncharacterized protein (DUF983 family)